jgi:hypothetical protein
MNLIRSDNSKITEFKTKTRTQRRGNDLDIGGDFKNGGVK